MADSLVGKFFHSFVPEGTYVNPPTKIVQWQGQVRSKVRDGLYLVRLYDWMMGHPSNEHLIPLEKMLDWQFYSSPEDWKDWYEQEYSPQVKGFMYEKNASA